ncbi:MAG: hypothetical protein FI709_15160 [SAR202 cluster bacterium]|nr:hypothetical protein [SAR202 cluster bacterium]
MAETVIFWLVVAIIVGAVVNRRSSGQADVGMMVRRVIEYGFLLALVGITGLGVAGVLAQVVGEIGPDSSAGNETTALWLTFVLVGGASLAGLAAWIRRRFAGVGIQLDQSVLTCDGYEQPVAGRVKCEGGRVVAD